jgi:hypothetical protein
MIKELLRKLAPSQILAKELLHRCRGETGGRLFIYRWFNFHHRTQLTSLLFFSATPSSPLFFAFSYHVLSIFHSRVDRLGSPGRSSWQLGICFIDR